MAGYPAPELFSRPWDVVVVGSGAAGLMACLELPDSLNVLLLTKDSLARSSSRWAQGGIAAALRPDDSTEAHFHDTLATGGGLCEPTAVRMLVEEAPRVVERLLGLGVRFDRLNGQLSCTLEAAHSQRRVLHAADQTGRAIVEVLQARVRERPGLVQVNEAMVLQLWRRRPALPRSAADGSGDDRLAEGPGGGAGQRWWLSPLCQNNQSAPGQWATAW